MNTAIIKLLILLDALPSEALVRIAPSLRAKHGAVWSKYPFPHADWQIDVSVRVTGRGLMGADGLVYIFALY